LSVLQASGAKPFTLLRVCDLDVPAFQLERVVPSRAPVIDSITAHTGTR
jgi:hypothetical protein